MKKLVMVAASAAVCLAAATPVLATAVAEKNAPADKKVISGVTMWERHTFSGSSTAVSAFQKWFAGEEFVQPEIETMDLTALALPCGEIAYAGDIVYKDNNGEFHVYK
ncbi:hypothetical protein EML15_05585 [Corynebacterium sp. sy017]|uniref:hypothetical protein n=1 Tax=unclassified Corynebacterium TaxID=2624378 RepID=UPI001186A569|nr:MULTISPECIES: hypothetical protein [unclassified Corynebacterium]MBP3088618.1 hypothetical protein [Corynebacterium sp. sy017]QDZ42025.1 hypothetical protein FQV43_01705 [Corynebacterium sp. sy039]TSD91910.1 hypothetical protein ELY17_05585 [Corynebacterium sp. SY003]